MNNLTFGPVISSYTSEQAVDDGVLVAVTTKDMVTRQVFDFLSRYAAGAEQPPDCWPIELMTWVRAAAMPREVALKLIAELGKDGAQAHFKKRIGDNRACSMAKGLIDVNLRQAQKVYDDNIGGGIWKHEALDRTFWLVPNELGGMTLMFPEDY
jgi:hypothetical protein